MKKFVILTIILMQTVFLKAQNIESWIDHQLQTYPKARLIDIYKSCFQDYLGAEHLVSNAQNAGQYLEEELNAMELQNMMPWYVEPCGIDSAYFRVSLRVVKEGIVAKEALLDAFIRSANNDKHPSVEQWRERWHDIMATIDRMQLNLPHYQEDKVFIEDILAKGKYAVSHSAEFREAYHPHYRIVERNIYEHEIQPLIQKAMVVRMAEIEVYPEYLELYLSEAGNVGGESVRQEPGVICIFPMQMKDEPSTIRIVEIYRSRAAYEAHLKTPHFLHYKKTTSHMVKSLKLVDQTPLDAASMNFIFKKMQ